MLDRFAFTQADQPVLTVRGPSGSLEVDLGPYSGRPVSETGFHLATKYAQTRMGFA